MTKYSAPSIEVINFNSSDAPRIGMQWWAEVQAGVSYIALGQNWVATNGLTSEKCVPVEYTEGPLAGMVNVYRCFEENIPNALVFVDHLGRNINFIIDDMKSC